MSRLLSAALAAPWAIYPPALHTIMEIASRQAVTAAALATLPAARVHVGVRTRTHAQRARALRCVHVSCARRHHLAPPARPIVNSAGA